MKSKTWTFPILRLTLQQAAQRRADRHQSRLAFWQAELTTATNRLKSEGVTIEEPAEARQHTTYAGNMQIVIDPSMQQRVRECQDKVRDHRDRLAEFRRWEAAFSGTPLESFDCDIDDLTHFGIYTER